MWPRRAKKPDKVTSVYGSYLRGRQRVLGQIGDEAAAYYLADDQPMRYRVAFVLGCLADRDAPLLTRSGLEAQVRDRLDAGATDPGQLPNLPAGAAELQSGD